MNNNGGGNQSKRGFDRVYGGTQTEQALELWTYTKVNFAKIAEDMGAIGIRVEKPAELGPAIQKALTATALATEFSAQVYADPAIGITSMPARWSARSSS